MNLSGVVYFKMQLQEESLPVKMAKQTASTVCEYLLVISNTLETINRK